MITVEKDYIELTDFLSPEVQDNIENLVTHPSFPWSFVYDSVGGYTGESGTGGAAGFFHNLVFNSQTRSPDLPAIMPIAHAMEKELASIFKVVNYNRIRIGFQWVSLPPSLPQNISPDVSLLKRFSDTHVHI